MDEFNEFVSVLSTLPEGREEIGLSFGKSRAARICIQIALRALCSCAVGSRVRRWVVIRRSLFGRRWRANNRRGRRRWVAAVTVEFSGYDQTNRIRNGDRTAASSHVRRVRDVDGAHVTTARRGAISQIRDQRVVEFIVVETLHHVNLVQVND